VEEAKEALERGGTWRRPRLRWACAPACSGWHARTESYSDAAARALASTRSPTTMRRVAPPHREAADGGLH
jgi:hypothetical protein